MDKKTIYYIVFGCAVLCGFIGFIVLLIWFTKEHSGGLKWEDLSKGNIHIFIMYMVVLFQGIAISVFRLLDSFEKKYVVIIHACIHGVIFLMLVLAMVAIFDYKSPNFNIQGGIPPKGFGPPGAAAPPHLMPGTAGMNSNKHINNFHGVLGITTVLLFSIQVVAAILIYYVFKKENLMVYHKYIGIGIFALTVINAIGGLSSTSDYGEAAIGNLEGPGKYFIVAASFGLIYGVTIFILAVLPEFQ